jgi:PAS domain S-box-containing protein
MTGYSVEEWLGDPDLWPSRIHPDDRERVLALRRKTAESNPFASEYRLLRRDGTLAWWRDEARLVWDPTSRLLVYGFVQDVTERKRAEEELRAQREALHLTEKLAAIGELMAGVAHELNNPLAVVLGQASLLQRQIDPGPGSERIEKIARAAERCARIVKNFLAISRQQPPTRQSVDLIRVIEETTEVLAHSLRMDGVEVKLSLARDLPAVSGDPHQLQQVLLNLLSNAHHALREAPPPRRIEISTAHDAGSARIVLSVADTGPGIAPETRGRIFDPFFTTKPPGKGTGLGLSLCRSIVTAHDGSIELETPRDGGARFWIALPVGAAAPEGRANPQTDAASTTSARRILVVDDEPGVAELIAELLAEEGHQVDVAANGKEALLRLETAGYDVVLSDLRMPELDGPGLHREVAERFPALVERLVFVTGDSLTEETRGFFERSGAPYISKPLSIDELQRVIREVSAGPTGAATSAPPTRRSPPTAGDDR